MKQHITVEQLNELSEEGKKKLRAYGYSELIHESYSYFYSPFLSKEGWLVKKADSDYDDSWVFCFFKEEYPTWHIEEEEITYAVVKGLIPLLSISQMIEFLAEGSRSYYLPGCTPGESEINPEEWCDDLWEAVKSKLEQHG